MKRCDRYIAALAVSLMAASTAAASSTLTPYQMVRSLQLVQDRIADGDHAALPMQNKLLGMIDQRMRETESHEFVDRRNFEALLVYGMSGGNPVTIDRVLARIHPAEADRALAQGVLAFLSGRPQSARSALSAVEPMALPIALGAPVALVRGSVIGSEEPKAAIRMLDQARLLGSGTLVEEAALRRILPLATAMRDPARFLSTASAYVRFYLRSPYAGEFAQSFVAGIIELHDILDRAALDDVIAMMTPEQQQAIYLRLARKGAIDDIPALSAFANAPALAASGEADPRAALYASMASIKTETIDAVAARLSTIDRERLSSNDRQLLDAVNAVVSEVLARPQSPRVETSDDQADPIEPEVGSPPKSKVAEHGSEAPVATEADEATAKDAALDQVTTARRKLDEIDELLKETTR